MQAQNGSKSSSSSSSSASPAPSKSRKQSLASTAERQREEEAKQAEAEEKALKELLEEKALAAWSALRSIVLEGNVPTAATEFKQLLLNLSNYEPIPLPAHNFTRASNEDAQMSGLPVASSQLSTSLAPSFRYAKNIGKGSLTTSMTVHPSLKYDAVFVGMEDGHIGVWSLTKLRKESEKATSGVKDGNFDVSEIETKLYRWRAHILKPKTALDLKNDMDAEASRQKALVKLIADFEKDYGDYAEDEKPPRPKLEELKSPTPRVSCLKLAKAGDALYSGSHDGTIRLLKFRSITSEEVMKITPYKVLCFDIEGKNLWAGDNIGQLHYRDLSVPASSNPIRKFDIHPAAVRTISINPHPDFSHLGVTAHDYKPMYPGKGDMIFWDLDKLLNLPNPDRMRNVNVTAAYWVEETRQGVVSAYFDRSGSKLLETSFGLNYANRGVSIWKLKERGDNLIPVMTGPNFESKDRLQTSYTKNADVIYLSAQWSCHSVSEPTFTIGNYSQGGMDMGGPRPNKPKMNAEMEFVHLSNPSTKSKSDCLITATHPQRDNIIYSGGNIWRNGKAKQETGFVQFFCGPKVGS